MCVSKPKIIAVVGPTSSGKTALGVYLARKLGGSSRAKPRGEIISADSRQVYRGLNIGTGKATLREQAGIPHHLLDVASPKKQFSANEFLYLGTKALKKIMIYHKLPIIVGGTGLYVDALLGRMSVAEAPPDEKLRRRLEKKSVSELFSMLKKKDPARAKTIEPEHKRRLVRALEIATAIGRSPSLSDGAVQKFHRGDASMKFDVLWLGIAVPEPELKRRIRARLRARLRRGMVAEGRRLHAQGLSYKRMEELGLEYRALAKHLRGDIGRAEMTEKLERDIWKYAKRQMRWFKRNSDIRWVKNKTESLRLAKKFLGGR